MAHFDDFCVLGKGLLHATHVSWGQLQSTIIAPFFYFYQKLRRVIISQINLIWYKYAAMLSSRRLTHRHMLSMRKTEQVCEAITFSLLFYFLCCSHSGCFVLSICQFITLM